MLYRNCAELEILLFAIIHSEGSLNRISDMHVLNGYDDVNPHPRFYMPAAPFGLFHCLVITTRATSSPGILRFQNGEASGEFRQNRVNVG